MLEVGKHPTPNNAQNYINWGSCGNNGFIAWIITIYRGKYSTIGDLKVSLCL